jgi:outer membrane protein assembly factor BamA
VYLIPQFSRYSGVNKINIFLLVFGLLFPCASSAQKSYVLRLLATDLPQAELEKAVRYKTTFSDSTGVFSELKSVIRQLHEKSMLEASADTVLRSDSIFTAFVHVGPTFSWLELQPGNARPDQLKAAGFRPGDFRNRPLQWPRWKKMQADLLQQNENEGHPFAQVSLTNVSFENARISGAIEVLAGPRYQFGKLEIEGNLRLSNRYLYRYLGIAPGEPYHQGRVMQMRDRLRALPFVSLKQDPQILFRQDSTADILLQLDPRKAGRFDFLIGVLPNSAQVGRMLITGSLFADFYNQFGQGERITASFERLRPETQQLSVLLKYPYVLQLPFGVDARFQLYKRDTTFLNLEYSAGADYLLEGASYWKAFWQHRSTRLTGIDEARLLSTRRLPAQLDVSNDAFGLETAQQRTDYRLNPRRGWTAMLRASAGVKRVKPNSRIVALGLSELYDTIATNSAQYRLEFSGEYYLPVLSSAALKWGLQGAWLLSPEPVFRNEQFRIGGNRLLRGFDEEFFFATGYAVATAEMRLLIGQNSRIYSFADLGRVEDRSSSGSDIFYAFGFGAGIALETKAGLLGLSLALGSRTDMPLDFSAPKVHVGYVGLF